MANTSCPFPFIDSTLFPKNQGYIEGRLCGTIPLPGQKPGAECCLPCPGQEYYLHPSILTALHWNDIANVIGVGVGAFVLLVTQLLDSNWHQSFIFLPEKITYRSSLGISISLAAFLINVTPFSNISLILSAASFSHCTIWEVFNVQMR